MKVTTLRCDYMENPVGFDFSDPSFGWQTQTDRRSATQSAYQMQFSLEEDFASPLLDLGWIDSNRSVDLRAPIDLQPRTRYYWRVRVRDDEGNESPFSEKAYFETGRYQENWGAKWIGKKEPGGLPQLRRAFTLPEGNIRRARVYASGVGMYCLFLNGKRAGNELLTPFINAYDKWIQYQTIDVTPLLAPGENCAGAWLGNGYYAGRVNWPGIAERRHLYGDTLGLLFELIVDYEDGRCFRLGSDESWRASESPLLRSEIYDGEYFDARRELPGWSKPGFAEGPGWNRAAAVKPPKGRLEARKSVPVRVTETLPCLAVITTPAGETVLDFGQNMAGRVRFRVDAPAGAEILLQAGEVLDKHGNFYRDNMRTALAEERYICRGGGEEYAPFMSFMGFRYVRVTGWPGEIHPEAFTAEVIHSQMEITGSFNCSDERVNRLFLNALWGQRGNFVDVPTDCPQRDERMGWTGDAQVFCATACMNMESDAFYRKYLYDLWMEQRDHGYVPVVVPFFINGSGLWDFTTTGWGDAATIIPWDLYLYYGDKKVLENQFDSMTRWVDFMSEQDVGGTDRYEGFHLGDWLAQDTADPFNLFGATPTELIATAYYAWSAHIVAKAAKVLDRKTEEEKYRELYERIRAAFRREFMTPNGRVLSETQTALSLVLYMGLCDEEERSGIAQQLAKRIRTDRNLLSTGFIGTPYLCPALSENGLNEYAYELLLSTGRPSWLYAVERGATTIWERWNGIDENGDFGPVSMNSFNHYAYGSIAEWLYRCCAGINPVEYAPGFQKSLLAPLPNDRLRYAGATIRTQYGKLCCSWRIEGDTLTVEAEIPFNTDAEIRLPDSEGAEILENGAPLEEAGPLRRGSGKWVYRYRPNGKTIGKRIVPDVHPKF